MYDEASSGFSHRERTLELNYKAVRYPSIQQ